MTNVKFTYPNLWKTLCKTAVNPFGFSCVSYPQPIDLPTARQNPQTQSPFTHIQPAHSPRLSHNRRPSGINRFIHTIHKPNNSNKIIMKGA
jgi:hypothetical protein